uniref:Guanylate cyclase n=1 Tax=Strigamia maritima TaxID=126957 RepID=T1ITS9_STRMM
MFAREFLHASNLHAKICNIVNEPLILILISLGFFQYCYNNYNLLYFSYVILGQYYEHLGLMVTMQKKGLFENGEYFVVGVDIEQYDQDNPGMYLRDETEDIAQVAYQSYIGVIGSPPVGFEEFSIKVNDYMEKEPFNYPNPLTFLGGRKRIRAEAAYLYDAVYVYARALNETLGSDEDAFDGRVMFKYMRGQTYKSAMGYIVHMDENGDAEGNYTLVARKPILHSPGQYGLFPIGTFIYTDNDSIPVLRLNSSIDWIGLGPPIDEPKCGFRNELCTSRTSEVIAGVAGGIVLTFMIIVLIAYRNWKYEQELDSLLWKIDFREIKLKEFIPATNGNGNCKTSRMVHPVIRASQISLNSNPDLDFRYSTIYTQIGYYKGHICAVKWVRKKNIDITRKMKKELKIMRDLHHDNLNSFIGACVDPPNVCIITEYCARGSLKDILQNVEVKLDNMFIASLVDDIIRGMIYLHDGPIRSHGRLESSNCLVDSRWVLKITDFGLQEFKDGAEINDQLDPSYYYESLLYRAPELLRSANTSSNGTQKGDVYSFAIILYEIHCRQGPFGTIDMTPQEILKRVIDGTDAGTPFRPQLELMDNPSDYVKICLRECWNEVAEERPDFKIIRQRIRPQRKGMRSNIFDNMIAMMEKYANNLEALVDEKTDQLIEEKKKTDALLYEMLPRYVIEQLKGGKPVEAESFDTVTIYFSDIVGFTEMSAQSTPLQVVDFLNDLYTCFDSIIENYDVYKVETIGDAYMVVSGLPIRNGDSHAGEIASMSLHLLDAVRKFIIRHRPNDKLKLRIGIHSGPVCAGVVGLKMPRYCLFGDTVNTASRMESNGSPLKVHCSYQCRDILDKLGGYTLEERGFVKMKFMNDDVKKNILNLVMLEQNKSKGEMKTYW